MAVNSGGPGTLEGQYARHGSTPLILARPQAMSLIFVLRKSGILVISRHVHSFSILFFQVYTTLPQHFPQVFHQSAIIPPDHARSEAVMGNHICCAQELVAHGALCERRDAHGQPVLQKAAERCGERMVEILVEVPWP